MNNICIPPITANNVPPVNAFFLGYIDRGKKAFAIECVSRANLLKYYIIYLLVNNSMAIYKWLNTSPVYTM